MNQLNPYEPTESGSHKKSVIVTFVLTNRVEETGVASALLAILASTIAPITASTDVAVWNQLPDMVLLPQPWNVGWLAYLFLCFVWGTAVGILSIVFESIALVVLRCFVSARHAHWALMPILCACGFMLGASYHGGLPR